MKISRMTLVGVALVVFAATVCLYWPTVHGEFLHGDDFEYLRQSVHWNGLTWNAVKWAFTCMGTYYHPLPELSHVLDYQFWGKNAVGHHLTNVVVHALNAALVFGFLWTLLGATSLTAGQRLTVAAWVAAVFAIHPLQVESVAWVSGRTQLLCTTFGIGSLWAYTAGARRWLVWGLFAGALLCKPMAISFPFVMLAIDYFPLRRHEQFGWGRLLWEKAAWIGVAAAASLATLNTTSHLPQITPLAPFPSFEHVFVAFESLMFYPLKLVWPSHLSPSYPVSPGLSLDQGPVLASVLSVVMVTAVAFFERRRLPMLAAAWGAYMVLILPVSGLMPTGFQVFAQRYAYMSMLPLLLLAGAAGVWVWQGSMTAVRLALIGVVAGQLCFFGARTCAVIPDWRNDEALRRTLLAEFPNSGRANRDLAMLLMDQGRASEALQYAQRDVEIEPQLWLAHVTLGSVLGRLGRVEEAMAQDEQALGLNPDSATAHFEVGNALLQAGKVEEAIGHYEQAVRLKPDYAEAHFNLGNAFMRAGELQEAISRWEQALRLMPDDAEAHNNLGNALLQAGKTDDALRHYEQALRLNPDSAEAHNNLGNALLRAGKVREAIAHYEQALRIRPDFAIARINLERARAIH